MKNTETTSSTDTPETKSTRSHWHSACCSSSTSWIWMIVRIFIVVLLIVGAYCVGVRSGAHFSHMDDMRHFSHMDDMRYDKKDRIELMERRMDRMRSMNTVAPTSMNHDPMSMSMMDMSKMLVGKTGDALDRAFIEGMIPHHQGAIDMAQYLTGAKHPELRAMGQEIIKAQTAEIEQMQKWLIEWGYTNTGTTSSGAQTPPGMHMMPDGTMMHN